MDAQRGAPVADEVGMALPGLGWGAVAGRRAAGALCRAGRPGAVARTTVAAEGSWARHLASPLGLFLLQLLVLLLVAKGAGALLKRLGQPAVIGEMAAGLMMGPLVLGSLPPQLQGALFPASSLGPLGMLSQLGVLMFLLVAGAELDLAALRGRRRFAFTVSHAASRCRSCSASRWRSGCTRSTARRAWASPHSRFSLAYR